MISKEITPKGESYTRYITTKEDYKVKNLKILGEVIQIIFLIPENTSIQSYLKFVVFNNSY